MKCKSRGCEREQKARGWCQQHYRAARASGKFEPHEYRKVEGTASDRVWGYIDKRDPDECWPWTGGSIVGGYGLVFLGPGKRVRAHRAVWEIVNGPIPPGEGYHGTVVMHLCDNRICCNPSHLRLGTQGDNNRDMIAKGRAVQPRKYEKGSKHIFANPNLNDDAVREIRQAQGRKAIVDMACKYDLEIANVYQIRARRTWKHVA